MQREFISEITAINDDKSAAAEGWQSNGLLLYLLLQIKGYSRLMPIKYDIVSVTVYPSPAPSLEKL